MLHEDPYRQPSHPAAWSANEARTGSCAGSIGAEGGKYVDKRLGIPIGLSLERDHPSLPFGGERGRVG